MLGFVPHPNLRATGKLFVPGLSVDSLNVIAP